MNRRLFERLNELEKETGLITLALIRAIVNNTSLKTGQALKLVRTCRNEKGDIQFTKLRNALKLWIKIEDMKSDWLFEFNSDD